MVCNLNIWLSEVTRQGQGQKTVLGQGQIQTPSGLAQMGQGQPCYSQYPAIITRREPVYFYFCWQRISRFTNHMCQDFLLDNEY